MLDLLVMQLVFVEWVFKKIQVYPISLHLSIATHFVFPLVHILEYDLNPPFASHAFVASVHAFS